MPVSAQGVVQSVTQLSFVTSVWVFSFQRAGRCVASRQRKVKASYCLLAPTQVAHQGGGRGGGGRLTKDSYGPSVWTLVSLVRARAVLCVRETCRVQTCGRVSERACVCTRCGAVSHATVFCHVSVGLFFLACGALCGVASEEGHSLLLPTRAYTGCTPGRRSGRWRTFDERQLRTLCLDSCLSLVRARAVLCVRETCRVQTCGRVSERARVCTRCGAVSHATVFCHVSVGLFFLACGALCGVASEEGHSLPALRARRPPVHSPHAKPTSRRAHAEEVPLHDWHSPPLIP